MLLRAGYRVLGRNVTGRVGEADLVCLDPDGRTIVVVEVKSRRAGPPGQLPPEASVTAAKRDKLHEVTRALVRANRWEDRPVRIDVVGVEWIEGETAPVVRHHRGSGGGPSRC